MKSQKTLDPARILINLLKMLTVQSADSQTIIKYMEQYHISPDTYLPSIRGDIQIPLIYYCCSNTTLSDLFCYLIEKGVNVNTHMLCEDQSKCIELLYYSQIQYIPTLISHGCRLHPSNILESVEKLVIRGNITKLITLYKYKAITKEQLSPIITKNGLLFRILDQLYEKVYIISQQTPDETKFKSIYSEIMKNYINTFKFFIRNGANINQIENNESFVQKVLNTYFIELIQFVINCHPEINNEELLHYSNFGLLNRQVMKFIYNDTNFKTIEGMVREILIPKKINIKRNLCKKSS